MRVPIVEAYRLRKILQRAHKSEGPHSRSIKVAGNLTEHSKVRVLMVEAYGLLKILQISHKSEVPIDEAYRLLKILQSTKKCGSTYSSGPNCCVVPYKHVGWTFFTIKITVWS